MKSVIIIAIAFVFLFVPIGAYADTITVDIAKGSSTPACASSNSCYSPYTTIISSGDKVIWKNSDSVTHTITGGSPDDGPSGVFDSSTVSRGGSYAFTFEYAGSYDYFCMVHPWMEGIVVVQEKQKSSTSITLNLSKTSAYEGELVDVSGRLTSNGKPIPFTSVDIYEFDATSFDDKLGTLRTDSDGRFSNPFKTRDLDTGDGKDIAAILDILAIAVYCPVSCVSAVNNFINLAESSTVELYAKFPGNNNYKSSSSCKHPCREDTVTILESSNTMKGKVFNAVLSSTVPGGDLTTGILSSIVNSNQVSISQYDEIVSKYRLAFKTELGINANSLSLDEMKSLLDNPTELKKLKESQNKSNFTPKTSVITNDESITLLGASRSINGVENKEYPIYEGDTSCITFSLRDYHDRTYSSWYPISFKEITIQQQIVDGNGKPILNPSTQTHITDSSGEVKVCKKLQLYSDYWKSGIKYSGYFTGDGQFDKSNSPTYTVIFEEKSDANTASQSQSKITNENQDGNSNSHIFLPDLDGDGVPDNDDKCPRIFGDKDRMGCKTFEIKSTEQFIKKPQKINYDEVSVLQQESYEKLNSLKNELEIAKVSLEKLSSNSSDQKEKINQAWNLLRESENNLESIENRIRGGDNHVGYGNYDTAKTFFVNDRISGEVDENLKEMSRLIEESEPQSCFLFWCW